MPSPTLTLKQSQIPRFIIEAIAFGGLITVIIFNLTIFGVFWRITHNSTLCIKRVQTNTCVATNILYIRLSL